MIDLTCVELVPSEWTYCNEGNQHIALNYKGEHKYICQFVLKISKTDSQEEDFSITANDQLYQSHNLNQYHLVQKIIRKNFDKQFISDMQFQLQNERKKERLDKLFDDKVKIFFEESYAFQSFQNTSDLHFSVEIKPKSPIKQFYSENQILVCIEKINEQNNQQIDAQKIKNFIQQNYSETCLKFHHIQLEKKKKQSIDDFSKYNPRDFFQNSNLKQALKSLFDTPQRNLRAFHNFDQFPIDILESILQKEEIMRKSILEFQCLFQENTEKVYNAYKTLNKAAIYDDKIIQQVIRNIKNDMKIIDFNQFCPISEPKNDEENIELILKYLISFAWRDCSIMIKCIKINDSQDKQMYIDQNFSQLDGTDYLYKCCIIDYQIKPLKKIKKILQQEQEILMLYIQEIIQQNQ